MTEDQTNEKLLEGSQSHDFLSGTEDIPKLSAQEFLRNTPSHELKSIFGTHSESKNETPKVSTPPVIPRAPYITPDHLPNISLKTPLKPFRGGVELSSQKRSGLSGWKIFTIILLILLVVVIGLYIWGAMLSSN